MLAIHLLSLLLSYYNIRSCIESTYSHYPQRICTTSLILYIAYYMYVNRIADEMFYIVTWRVGDGGMKTAEVDEGIGAQEKVGDDRSNSVQFS